MGCALLEYTESCQKPSIEKPRAFRSPKLALSLSMEGASLICRAPPEAPARVPVRLVH